jgi:nucleotide-binding universal stress UspA family protein
MFRQILVPVDLADTDLAKSAIETAVSLARASGGSVRLLNVLPMTPSMLAEYVPPDFDAQQRQSAEEALAIIAKESGLSPAGSPGRSGRAASITRSWRRRSPCAPISSS